MKEKFANLLANSKFLTALATIVAGVIGVFGFEIEIEQVSAMLAPLLLLLIPKKAPVEEKKDD